MSSLSIEKSRARLQAKAKRARVTDKEAKAVELIAHWPAARFRGASVAGFWPMPSEIDMRPLLTALEQAGQAVLLPVITRKSRPLSFRRYKSGDSLKRGPHGTQEPMGSAALGRPNIVLVPMLAFTASGKRLGYGGGYYDRTLAELKLSGEVFACGVAFSAQEARRLPTGAHDIRLDAVLTDTEFREFI